MKNQHIALAAAQVQSTQVQRCSTMVQDTVKLAMTQPDPGTFAEAAELARATTEQAIGLQKQWAQDWANWMAYASTISGADTIPKIADRSSNIVLQAQAQMANQVTQMSELVDNAMVSYNFWVAQKIGKD
ncbi:MAG: hypothetical protein AAGF71_01990 [Pseudomonadota bacterium]